jgi:hypothetical protein
MKCSKKNQRHINRILYMQLIFVPCALIDMLSKIRLEVNTCCLDKQRNKTFSTDVAVLSLGFW